MNKVVVIAGVCLVIAAFAILNFKLTSKFVSINKDKLEVKLKRILELSNPGASVEIISLNEHAGLIKVVAKLTFRNTNRYLEFYATRNGEWIIFNPLNVTNELSRLERSKKFVECLEEKGLKIYGVLNVTQNRQAALATLNQLNLLGLYSFRLFVSCDGPGITNCMSMNITRVPTVVINGKKYEGIKSLDWFEQATGCKY